MDVEKGNIWEHHADGATVVITTNGSLKSNGSAVMGVGIAAQAVRAFPQLPKKLGEKIQRFGNRLFHFEEERVIAFPVKGDWKLRASLSLIEISAIQLAEFIKQHSGMRVVIPKPGCGVGGLLWENVMPVMTKHLGGLATIVDLG